MKYFFTLFSFLLLVSCHEQEEKKITHFGGQIINPKSDQVFIYKGEQLLDSAYLNHNNKFLMELDSISLGLYKFKHGPETQYLYLEPKDSLLIRINTWDFDESLVFSGKGAERNNLLINLFLENEKEDKIFFNNYHLDVDHFEIKIDSVLQQKKLLFDHFKEEMTENSPLFEKLVHAAIYYPLYRIKEAYPYQNKKVLNSKNYIQINPSFYKFRKTIDINDKELEDFYPHRDYLRTFLYHLAFEKQIVDGYKSAIDVNFMQATLENVKLEDVKNKFLHQGIWYTLLDDNISVEEKNRAQRLFFDHCSDERQVDEIAQLIKASEKLPKGFKLPDVDLYLLNNDHQQLSEIIKNKSTIIYTWPTDLNQIDNLAKRVNYLEKKYPDYLFIGINSKNSEYQWKNHIKTKKINPNHQYRVNTGNDWLDLNFTRAILIDRNGIVQNNLTHLSSGNFEKQLKNFIIY